jgi:hypothetical protein
LGAGAQVLKMGIAQVAWVLAELRRRRPGLPFYLDWAEFTGDAGSLFLWEAFVSGKAKAATHVGDAAAAAEAFRGALPDPTAENALTADRPLSQIGAALIWAGWSDDPSLLRQSCLVLKPPDVAVAAAEAKAVATNTPER